jgi:hypothetical protein
MATFIPHPMVSKPFETVNEWAIIIASFAMVLGIASLIKRQWTRVRQQVKGWGYNAVTLITLFITAGIGILWGMDPNEGDPIIWVYDHLNKPLSATIFSLTVFFIASAAFKAFRIRSKEATILLVAGIIVMMGQTPLGGLLWEKIPLIKDWILTYPNMAAQRGILLGLGLSMFSTSLKILLGIERGYLGGSR